LQIAIRGAWHSWNRLNRSLAGAKAIREQTTSNQIEVQNGKYVDQGNEYS
jgi:hypothetical protein